MNYHNFKKKPVNSLAKHKTQNMDKEVQVQFEYGPKRVQKLKIPDVPCTYHEFICDIQCQIPILRNIELTLGLNTLTTRTSGL